MQQDVQYWYSNDTDLEASGSDKNDNESDDVVAEENNSDDGQLWRQREEQYWFPKSWFSYDTDVEEGNSTERKLAQQLDADDVVVEASDSDDEIPRAKIASKYNKLCRDIIYFRMLEINVT